MILLEEIRQIRESKKDLKKFGLTVGPILLAIGVLLFIKGSDSAVFWGGAGFLLIVLSFAAPVALKPFNKVWMSLAIILGWGMTRLILVVLFYLALTPTGLIAKLFGKDFMDQKIDKSRNSYWDKRERKFSDKQSLERQF